MIPKKIHYCWFGNRPLPKSAKRCIESWKKYFPEYEIIEWNESNFNVKFNKYAYQAYVNKKYAFFTDVARLYIIYNYGGIYFDVDVEVIKSYEDIVSKCNAFFGIENENFINTGLGFGATKGNNFIKKLLDDYNNRKFVLENGTFDLTACPKINSPVFIEEGFKLDNSLEKIDNILIFPKEYFNSLNIGIGKVNITENTHSIHWCSGTWLPKYKQLSIRILRPLRILLGEKYNQYIKIIKKHMKK